VRKNAHHARGDEIADGEMNEQGRRAESKGEEAQFLPAQKRFANTGPRKRSGRYWRAEGDVHLAHGEDSIVRMWFAFRLLKQLTRRYLKRRQFRFDHLS
jgi:hypothetical protein